MCVCVVVVVGLWGVNGREEASEHEGIYLMILLEILVFDRVCDVSL